VRPTVYLETTIPSYLTARPSRDLLTAARQQLTSDWWEDRRHGFECVISQVVLDECGIGNAEAANRRLEKISGLSLLVTTPAAIELAARLIESGLVPKEASDDALHIATATVHEAAYLLTWNFKHIANATKMKDLRDMCSSLG
jgi:predicted nucleic acid-binding protein